MALIKCPQCGNMVSDRSVRCPRCGCPTSNPVTQYRNEYDVATSPQPMYETGHNSSNGSNKWLYVIIGLLLAAVTGGVFWLLTRSDENRETQQKVEQSEKETETVVNQPQQETQRTERSTTKQTIPSREQKTTREKPKQRIVDGDISLSGAIQGPERYIFDMNLNVHDDNSVGGTYIVRNGANQTVYLKGSYNEDNSSVTIYEYDAYDRKTGYYFTGSLRANNSNDTHRRSYSFGGRYKKNGTKVNWAFHAESY